MTRLHALPVGLVFAIAACSSERSVLQNTDEDGNGDSDYHVDTATCSDLYDRSDHCLGTKGCPGALAHDAYVAGCESKHFTPSELGSIVSMSCDELNIAQCLENNALGSLDCCKGYFTCPDGLICEPFDESDPSQGGVCVTAAVAFPADAKVCQATSDCDQANFVCVQGSSSSKCVQTCTP